jgi:UDP-N-acetylglucosamine--N-acetylmuramyl-(pentapeptide) pyrophosphoryl-undecaprenol N-acetylglucosamine transferase
MRPKRSDNFVAIACGGTGGHLFPGIAIGEKLLERGCNVLLLVSRKEVDQLSARGATGMEVASLPAVPLLKGRLPQFVGAFWQSFRQVRQLFKARRPSAVIAMGSFTSAPPILAGKLVRAKTAIHEANSHAGRANRLLAPWVDHAFIGFSSAANLLENRSLKFTGTPVRSQFQPADAGACRMALGLDTEAPVILVTGGSQGASAVNEAVCNALPVVAARVPGLQVLHLTGAASIEAMVLRYKTLPVRAKVLPFLTEMELALGAATVAVSRAGASSLAEMAAMQVPSILVPYPAASDDHQYYNARAFAQPGAARMMVQSQLRAEVLAGSLIELITDSFAREKMKVELEKWYFPDSAEQIVETVLRGTPYHDEVPPSPAFLKFKTG